MTWVHTPSHVCFCFELSPGPASKIMHWCSGDTRAERIFPTAGGISHEGLFSELIVVLYVQARRGTWGTNRSLLFTPLQSNPKHWGGPLRPEGRTPTCAPVEAEERVSARACLSHALLDPGERCQHECM